MPKRRGIIPHCRSTFLQDVSIALGRLSLKAVRYANPKLNFELEEEEVNGTNCERLTIETRSTLGAITKVTLWEDGVCWVYFAKRRGKTSLSRSFETHATLAGVKPDEVALLLRETMIDIEAVQHCWQRFALPALKNVD